MASKRILSGVPDEAIAALSDQLSRRPVRSQPGSRAPSPDARERAPRSAKYDSRSRGNSPPPLASPRPSISRQDPHKGDDDEDIFHRPERGRDSTLKPTKRKTVIWNEELHVEHPAPVYQDQEKPKRRKLGTFDGVFTPVCLNILGVILFLRFGFLLGQAGLLGVLALLAFAYLIDLATTASVAAIATNGHVRGGGPYYLLSRTLGPEFGGSLGIVFLLGQAANASLNILGFIEALISIFGVSNEETWATLPEGPTWQFAYASTLLLLCTAVCLVGSKLFSRATSAIALLMVISIASIPVSLFLKSPFETISDAHMVRYTGPSLHTLHANLWPHFTAGAAGSGLGHNQREGWQSTFAVLFPACTGILAGASMSGDLRKPSKSISKGTFAGLGATFTIYVVALLCMACSIKRETFREDLSILQDISIAPVLIHLGVLGSTLFSSLLGILACAKVLQAIARDELIPILRPFRHGSEQGDDPTLATLAAYALCQLFLCADSVNTVASLVTMASLLVFGIISLACFVLRVSASPNFRPSFRLFNEWTALAGILLCFGAMLLTDFSAAAASIIVMIVLVVVIHYTSEAKEWGDAAQALIYHQVRKYLLILDERKQHVKFWRPAVLLLTADPRQDWSAILFANSVKKGGLLVLGHVLKGSFAERLHDLHQQQIAWLRLVDVSHVKAFVDIAIADNERAGAGARNLMLSCGLGGMRPNIIVVTYPGNLDRRGRGVERRTQEASASSDITVHAVPTPPQHAVDIVGALPTDSERQESPISATAFVGIVEDAVALNKAVGVCYGFTDLRLPIKGRFLSSGQKRYIDLWPTLSGATGWATYTMVLLLGTTLASASSWRQHTLRVNCFTESHTNVAAERHRISALLGHLRVRAELRVFALDNGRLKTYEALVKGDTPDDALSARIDGALGRNSWYKSLEVLRKRPRRARGSSYTGGNTPSSPSPSSSRPRTPTMSVSPRPEHQRHWQSFNAGLAANRTDANALRLDTSVLDAHVRTRRGSSGSDSSDGDTDDESDADLASLSTAAAAKTFRAYSYVGLPDEPRSASGRGNQYGALDVTDRKPPDESNEAEDEDDELSSTPKARSKLCEPSATPTKSSSARWPTPPATASLPTLNFGDLPLRGQLIILNELMAQNSASDTSVCITSLAPPDPGSAESYEKSMAWLDLLRHWLDGLPPTLAVSSREQVMTTAL